MHTDGQKRIFFGCRDDNFYAVNDDGSLHFSHTASDEILTSPALLEYENNFYVFLVMIVEFYMQLIQKEIHFQDGQ